MTNRILTLAGVTAVLLGLSAPAQAQTQTTTTTTSQATQTTTIPSRGTTTNPTWEFGLGYQFLRTGEFCADFDASNCSEDNPQSFPFGLTADAVRNWGPFGIAGQIGWSRNSEELDDNVFGGDSLDQDVFHAAAGVRFTGRWGRTWGYGEVLGGVGYLQFNGIFSGLAFKETRTRPLAQMGGGLTFVVGDGWGIFVQADYRRMFLDEEEDLQSGRNDVRASVGFRLILD